ncbi:hypothetical protein BDV95DRAFT_672659 [Massariosphaeria phaeospora]|uniref:Uncharacterized protein n=1 Tax=Massariosphaeria phaeospora TaxID=100035 RepID=A0A7C8I6C6_9PLEO|nr:hypothetical protein BDV95DRAFT_672659 [Massariosphaeria phaeospora]
MQSTMQEGTTQMVTAQPGASQGGGGGSWYAEKIKARNAGCEKVVINLEDSEDEEGEESESEGEDEDEEMGEEMGEDEDGEEKMDIDDDETNISHFDALTLNSSPSTPPSSTSSSPKPPSPSPEQILTALIAPVLTALHSPTSTPTTLSTAETRLLSHLHTHALTPTTLPLLIPALNNRHAITNKIATNIGLYLAFEHTPAADIEAMLTHLFTQGDWGNVTFNRAVDAIARFRRKDGGGGSGGKAARRWQDRHKRNEAVKLAREREREKRHREAERAKARRYGWTEEGGDVDAEFLPAGCACIADVILDVYGMGVDEYVAYSEKVRAQQKKKGGKFDAMNAEPSNSENEGFDAGAENKPIVRLPPWSAYRTARRPILAHIPEDGPKVEGRDEHMWPKTKSSSHYLLAKRKKRDRPVVKMPLIEGEEKEPVVELDRAGSCRLTMSKRSYDRLVAVPRKFEKKKASGPG